MREDRNILRSAIILLFFLGTVLVSLYVGMYIGESKNKCSPVESSTGGTGDKKENTWLFKDKLTSNKDSDTYEIDLRGNPLGGLLIIEFSAPSGLGSHPYKLTLLDGDKMPDPNIHITSSGGKKTQNALVDGGEIYYVFVETWGDRYDANNPYIVKIEFIPNSVNNSPDTAIPLEVPGEFKGIIASGGDMNYLKVGPVDTSGLLVVESSTDNERDFEIKLLDDKGKVVQEYMKQSIRYAVDQGKTYYIKAGSSYKTLDQSFSYRLDVNLIPNSVNSNPEDAIPVNMTGTVKGTIVSTGDSNWFKLDLRGYSDGDIIINFAVPEELFDYNGYPGGGGSYLMELLDENKINVVGRAMASPKKPTAFKRGMKQVIGISYPEEGIEGGKIYYMRVYSDRNYHPAEEYRLEIKSDTMVPSSVVNERPNRYVLKGNTADTAVSVNLPAHLEGRIISEDDVHWFKADLSSYSGGGVLTVNFTMPSKTTPGCEFICKQPVCFNPPQAPPDCYHYQFEVFGGDKITKVLGNSVAPDDNILSREVLKKGDVYYFKISASHGRYNGDEPYLVDVRFHPASS